MPVDLISYVAERIRTLRKAFGGGEGLSQDALAQLVGTTANTVSRWETGVYQPSLEDLERVARALVVPIGDLLPPEAQGDETGLQRERMKALLRAAKELPPAELEELRRYAEFRRLRAAAPRLGLPVRRRRAAAE